MANAIKIILLGITINLLALFATSLQSDSVLAGPLMESWLTSSGPQNVVSVAHQSASDLRQCMNLSSGANSCKQENKNPLGTLVDWWSSLLNVGATIGAIILFAAQAALPWETLYLAGVHLVLETSFILRVFAFVVVLVLSTVNAVMWITIAKVITTRQLN